jgi:hypothetical protein
MTTGKVHLLLFADNGARTVCGLDVYAYWPTRGVACVIGGQMIEATTALKLITCKACRQAMNRPADIKQSSGIN